LPTLKKRKLSVKKAFSSQRLAVSQRRPEAAGHRLKGAFSLELIAYSLVES
jgi:hypothetical protein